MLHNLNCRLYIIHLVEVNKYEFDYNEADQRMGHCSRYGLTECTTTIGHLHWDLQRKLKKAMD